MLLSSGNELVSLLEKRDEQAIGLLYDKYSGALYGIICNEIKDEDIAKDILTNVFICFLQKMNNKEISKEGVFICLYRICKKLIWDINIPAFNLKKHSSMSPNGSFAS